MIFPLNLHIRVYHLALDHLIASDASGIDRKELTNVLNELTTVSERLTQFLEADNWTYWEDARNRLN